MKHTIDEHILHWLQHIKQNWGSRSREFKVFDIRTRIQYLTVNIITHLYLDEALGYIENDSDTYGLMFIIKQGHMMCQYFSVLQELNALFFDLTKIPFVRKLLLPSATDKNGLEKIMSVWLHCFELSSVPLTYLDNMKSRRLTVCVT